MSYLSDEQIKILLVSKESPTICDTIMENDFEERCPDQLIKSSSDFNYFSLCLTSVQYNSSLISKIDDIIKFKLGKEGLNELYSRFNTLGKEIDDEYDAEKYERELRSEPEHQGVLESNTPDEDKDDWDYY